MFKQAYVRGVQNTMIQAGHVAFPDEKTAADVADYIGGHFEFDPVTAGVTPEQNVKIAEAIVDASRYFQKQPGFKAAAFTKVASEDDLGRLAHAHALHVMEKAAEGSTIEGGDKGNKEPTTGEGKMDLGERPTGYATDSRGTTEVDTRPGHVGKEEPQPAGPSRTDSKDNSVVEQSKTSSLGELLRKVKLAEGTTIIGGDKGNTEPTTAEGKMDLQQRPHGYAVLPNQGDLGELMREFGAGSHVGKETPSPNPPARTDSAPNSVVETSKKTAEADPYILVFQKTAAEVGPHLPGSLNQDQKIAHIRVCMGLNTEERAHYLVDVHQKIAAATVGSVPPGSRSDGYQSHTPEATHSRQGAYDGRKNNQGTKQAEDGALPPFMMHGKDKDKDEKKDDDKDKDEKKDSDGKMPSFIQEKIDAKKDGDKKEASLVERMRQLRAIVPA